jgi:hypothetical protein
MLTLYTQRPPLLLLQLLIGISYSELIMSLFPKEDILTREFASWKGYVDSLRVEDRKTFKKILNECYKYSKAINAKGHPFPSEAVIMPPVIFTTQTDRLAGNTSL